MNNVGEVIIKHRKLNGLTQKDIADKMHVSPQAVSKWERNQSEPDLKAIRDLAQIFDISVDEFLNLEKKETVIKEEVVVNKYMCDVCRELYTKDDLKEIGVNTTCNSCYEQKEIDNYNRWNRDTLELKKFRPFIIGGVIGLVLYVLIFLLMLLFEKETFIQSILIPLPVVILTTTFVTQMFYDSWLKDVFFFFLTRSIRMPGVIFSLSIDGLIFLIVVKLFLGLLSLLFTVIISLLGLFITVIISPVSYIIDIIRATRFTLRGREV